MNDKAGERERRGGTFSRVRSTGGVREKDSASAGAGGRAAGAGEEVRQGAGRLAALGGGLPPPRWCKRAGRVGAGWIGGRGCGYRGVIALCSDCRVLSVRAGGFLVYPGVRRRARAVVWLVCRWVVAGQEAVLQGVGGLAALRVGGCGRGSSVAVMNCER